MKRTMILIAVVLLLAMVLPMSAMAQAYSLAGTDVSLTVDDSVWYVFTRDNLVDNPELAELGITAETINGILLENNAYMDAIVFDENGNYTEMFVTKAPLDTELVNLSNYSRDEAMQFAQGAAEDKGDCQYDVYETAYKFARLEYLDEALATYVVQYVTVVNKDAYNFLFQSKIPFVEWDYQEMDKIMKSVIFAVDPLLKEPASLTGEASEGVSSYVGSAAAVAIVGGVGALIRKKSKKKKAQQTQENQ